MIKQKRIEVILRRILYRSLWQVLGSVFLLTSTCFYLLGFGNSPHRRLESLERKDSQFKADINGFRDYMQIIEGHLKAQKLDAAAKKNKAKEERIEKLLNNLSIIKLKLGDNDE